MSLRSSALGLLLLIGLVQPGYAGQAPSDAEAFISGMAQRALVLVPGETADGRQHRLEGFLDNDFDMTGIASFTVGRYWQKATDIQKQTFTSVFRQYMVHVYSFRFTQYNGESFRITGLRPGTAGDTVVFSEISQPNASQPIKMEWHIVDKGGFKITDIGVGGVSMAQTQRADFSSFLGQNGGDLSALTRQLQAKSAAP